MKALLNSLYQRVSIILKWSPVSCVYCFKGIRLRTFGSYYDEILATSFLPCIYPLLMIVSLIVLVINILSQNLENVIFEKMSSYLPYSSSCLCLLYHTALLTVLKCNPLEKRLGRVRGIFHVISILILHLMIFTFHLVPPDHMLIDIATTIFECSIATVYFQGSFLLSTVMFLLIATFGVPRTSGLQFENPAYVSYSVALHSGLDCCETCFLSDFWDNYLSLVGPGFLSACAHFDPLADKDGLPEAGELRE